jgi:hypothetical protein
MNQLSFLKPFRRGHSDYNFDFHNIHFLRQRHRIDEHPSAAYTDLAYAPHVSRGSATAVFGIRKRHERANSLEPVEGFIDSFALIDSVKSFLNSSNITNWTKGRP